MTRTTRNAPRRTPGRHVAGPVLRLRQLLRRRQGQDPPGRDHLDRVPEKITYNDGTARTCTSASQSWSAHRDSQPAAQSPDARPGSYTGYTSQALSYNDVGFSIDAGRANLQNVVIATVYLVSTTAGAGEPSTDRLAIDSIPIATDGSFNATRTVNGLVNGQAARFVYTFSGHVHGDSSSGHAGIAGAFRETVTYDDGTARTCTSNDQSWSALSS